MAPNDRRTHADEDFSINPQPVVANPGSTPNTTLLTAVPADRSLFGSGVFHNLLGNIEIGIHRFDIVMLFEFAQ